MAAQREWFEKDYYAVLGVSVGRVREGAVARLQEAREAVPPRRQRRRTRRPRSASRRSPPRTTCSATPRSARSTTRSGAWSRRASVPAVRAASVPAAAVGPGVPVRQSTSASRRRLRRPPRQPVRRRGAARRSPRRDRPAARPGPRDRAAPPVRRRGARRHQHGAVPRRRDVLAPAAVRAPRPARCPRRVRECHGSGSIAVDQGPFSFSQVCPTCGGRGQVIPTPCPTCDGRGVEVRAREVKVRVPAGVADGQRIRVKGRGGAGANGGPPGDLYVVVHVRGAPAVRAQRQRPHVRGCRSRSRKPRSAPT